MTAMAAIICNEGGWNCCRRANGNARPIGFVGCTEHVEVREELM